MSSLFPLATSLSPRASRLNIAVAVEAFVNYGGQGDGRSI
ncbi:MAG: hypothetical protein EWM73_03144 [Nitrospira sp.]|nr:MAG: hypothetical protein EWM73_03144 [Nitrospira sp.]